MGRGCGHDKHFQNDCCWSACFSDRNWTGGPLEALLFFLEALCFFSKKTTSTKAAPSAVQESQKSDLLDINSATKDQLATLPGIGAVYSQKIVDGRPYRAKTDLVRKNILPQSAYSKIATMIIARQPKSGTK